MAVDPETGLTYDVGSNREDLTDIIYNVDPTDTPMVTRFATEDASAHNHEWNTDSLRAATADNAVAQGDRATIKAFTDPSRLGNYCQLMDDTPSVSSTQQAVDTAGVDDYFDYQIVKGTKQIRRDLAMSVAANKSKVQGSRGTASVMAGLESWLGSNTSHGSGGSAPATTDGAATRTAGTDRSLVESLYKDNLRAIWDNGGQPDLTIVGSSNKSVISGFAGNATRFKTAEDQTLIATIDIYKGDYSELEVVANRWQDAKSVFNLQSDMFAIAWLQPCGWEYLAKQGHSDEALISQECTLESRNEKSSGAVYDCA